MSERSGKILLGLVLLIVGIVLVLDLLGIHLDMIMRMLIPGLMMIYGAKKLFTGQSSGAKYWGIFVFLFGLLMLIGKLDLLFTSLLAIIILYAGFRLLRGRSHQAVEPVSMAERKWAQAVLKEDALDRFEREWKERNH